MNRVIAVLLTVASMNLLSAQPTFTNGNDKLVQTNNHTSAPIGVADMNNDDLDDIIRLLDGTQISVELQQLDGTFTRQEHQVLGNSTQWTLSIADVNNDGYADILTGGHYNGVRIFTAENEGLSYTETVLPGQTIFAQGSNLADINNDGLLDAFVCHDDGESRIWSQEISGSWVQADHWINMATIPLSNNSGNYGSTWSDFDFDGDIDLYIAKCSQWTDDATSPLRLNALFVNDGDGNFTEEAEARGLQIGRQSWTSDFGDFDNDGDFDCVVTNHGSPSQFLENTGNGYFTDISNAAGFTDAGFPIQSIMRDFDNDGFLDILLSGGSQKYYRNNGDKTFTLFEDFIPKNEERGLHSFSVGDLNHDGFIDINGGYGEAIISPTFRDDILWLNDANDNHWVAMDLEGTASNRSAVGTKVSIHGDWGIQVREVRAGESYGISNSLAVHFGLGQHTTVDSIVLNWPSGNREIITNPGIDQYLKLKELECFSEEMVIVADGPTTFCTGDSVTLTAPDGHDIYEWNNGGTSQSITVTESGGYLVKTAFGNCISQSNVIVVTVDPDETPQILGGLDFGICQGDFVNLSTDIDDTEGFTWSTNESTASIDVYSSGEYFVSYQGLCNEFTSATITVEVNQTDPLIVEDDNIVEGESAVLVSNGINPLWYSESAGMMAPVFQGNTFTTEALDVTTTFYVEAQQDFELPASTTGILDPAIAEADTDELAGLYFQALQDLILRSVRMKSDKAGEVKIAVFDFVLNAPIAEKTLDLVAGEQTVQLNFEVPQGNDYVLYLDGIADELRFAVVNDPQEVDYPYTIPGLVQIISNATGSISSYDCFFSLVFQPKIGLLCTTERYPVVAYVESVNTNELDQNSFSIFPNPVSTSFTFETNENQKYELEIFDVDGKKVGAFQNVVNGELIQTEHWKSGAYFIKVINENGLSTMKRIIKIE